MSVLDIITASVPEKPIRCMLRGTDAYGRKVKEILIVGGPSSVSTLTKVSSIRLVREK